MSFKKIRDIVAKTGEYLDANGNRKGRYTNAGSLLYNNEDKSFAIILNRTFNPAGVPPSDKGQPDSVLLSCFEVERNSQTSSAASTNTASSSTTTGNAYANASQGGYASQHAQTSHQRPLDDDDEIPF